MYKGGKHVITENWGKYFLVAIQKDKSGDEKVLGTVSYKQRMKGEVQVGIEIFIIHPLGGATNHYAIPSKVSK